MKKKIILVLTTSVLALALTATSVAAGSKPEAESVGADGTKSEADAGRGFGLGRSLRIGAGLTEAELGEKLAAMVAEGRLTQEEADEMLARHKEMPENPGDFKTGEGVKDGKLVINGESVTLEELPAKLAEMVASGKITQERADQMLKMAENPEEYMSEMFHKGPLNDFNADDFEGGLEKGTIIRTKDLTEEELAEKLAEMVASGEITQEKADEILARHKEMPENPDDFKIEGGFGKGFMFGGAGLTVEAFSEQLADLVAEGKLTQEMADEMLARHKAMLENSDQPKDAGGSSLPGNGGRSRQRSNNPGDNNSGGTV